MGSREVSKFWTEKEEYHDLARTYEQNIERVHPDFVTTKGMCVCLEFTSWCDWAATSVDYWEYNGPSV